MKNLELNFMEKPSKNVLGIFTFLWIISTGLIIFSLTDLFTESLFRKENWLAIPIIFGSTTATFKLYINFWKNKKNYPHKSAQETLKANGADDR